MKNAMACRRNSDVADMREDKTRPQDAPLRQAASDKREHATGYGVFAGIAVLVIAGFIFAFWRGG